MHSRIDRRIVVDGRTDDRRYRTRGIGRVAVRRRTTDANDDLCHLRLIDDEQTTRGKGFFARLMLFINSAFYLS